MKKIKRCCDCEHYVPGGRDHNCAKAKGWRITVCALKEACDEFIPKVEKVQEVFEPLEFKRTRYRRRKWEMELLSSESTQM